MLSNIPKQCQDKIYKFGRTSFTCFAASVVLQVGQSAPQWELFCRLIFSDYLNLRFPFLWSSDDVTFIEMTMLTSPIVASIRSWSQQSWRKCLWWWQSSFCVCFVEALQILFMLLIIITQTNIIAHPIIAMRRLRRRMTSSAMNRNQWNFPRRRRRRRRRRSSRCSCRMRSSSST